METTILKSRDVTFVAILLLAVLGAAGLTEFAYWPKPANVSTGSPSGLPSEISNGTPGQAEASVGPGFRQTSAALAPPRAGLQFKGWRLESFGLTWFFFVIAAEFTSRLAKNEARERFRFYIFCMSIIGFGGVLWIAVDAGAKRAMPIEYWLAAGAVAGIFIAAALSTQSPLLSIARNIPRDIMAFTRQRTTWAIGALLVAVLGLRPAAAGVRHPPLGREFEVWYAAEPRVAFPVMVDKAPVLIVKFPDYQCPACRAAEEYYAPVFDDLNRQYPNAVRVIRYDFPLGADCNSLVVPGHDAACEAAVAVRLADERGRGPQMEQWLWANQSRFSRESIANAARDIGGATDFDARYDATLTRVRGDVEVGRKIGVRGTPAYFVNGVLLGFVPGINMRTAIVHELQALNLLPRPLPPGR